MLPAFPKIERLCERTARELIDFLADQRAPMLKSISKRYQFEGDHSTILRYDNSVGETPHHQVTAEVEFPRIPIQQFIEGELPSILNDIAEQMAKGKSEMILGEMEKVTTATGNVVDGKGEPLSEELILKSLEKMEHSFEPDGTWNPPTIVASPEAIQKLMERAKPDGSAPDTFSAALSKILDKKRNDFRLREADRVLAG